MRILIAGNLANMGYEIAKAMRNKGMDVKLLLPKYPKIYEDPKFMYPQLEQEGYPNWLVRYDNHNRSLGWKNWKFQVIREMRKKEYDVIIALTEFSIFAMFSGKPYGALSTGSDMRELSFEMTFKGFLYRLSYKKARFVIWGEPDKLPLLKKLRIEKKSIFATAPRNFDYKPQIIEKGKFENKFVIFHPVSQDWKLKKNDLFLKAFVRFCSMEDDVILLTSDRGEDIKKAKLMLDNKNTKEKVVFLPPLNSKEMEYYYNISDIVVDQFGVGSIGMITVEAMKCGKPVILYWDKEKFEKCYDEIPLGLFSATTEEEILNALDKLLRDKTLREKLSKENEKWIKTNWDKEKLTKRYEQICKAIYYNDISVLDNPSKIS